MSIALNSGRDNALSYAGRGWHVFPLAPGRKDQPLVKRGQNDATTDGATIARLFSGSGMANVGIHCRPSGLYVIDVDMNPWKHKVGEASWAALMAEHGETPTFTVRSWSGGLHLYYRYDGDLTNTTGRLGPDIDTRGNGYVVAAPSFVRETIDGVVREGSYEVIDDREPAELPQWIVEALTKPERAPRPTGGVQAPTTDVERRVHELAAEMVAAPKGTREPTASDRAFKAGQYVGAGQISHEDVVRIFLDAMKAWGRFHTAEGEQKMVDSITRGVTDGEGKPRPWEKPIARTLAVVPDSGVLPDVPDNAHGQLGMARRMLREKAVDLRYSGALGWHVWDGVRWMPDQDGSTLRMAHDVVDAAWADVPSQPDSDAKKMLIRDIGNVESISGMNGMLTHLGAMLPVAAGLDPFDRNAHLFNTPTATINLATREIRPHSREDMNAKVSRAGVGGERSAVFEKFLERILPKEAVRSYVQRLLGQAMLGRVEEHIMPIFTGEGRNGKGTLRDAVVYAFGDYATEIDPKILLEQKHDMHKTYEMELMGRRLVFCSETKKDRKFDEAMMKRLVGGDPIQGQRMHKDPVTFDPSHTLIMLTNDLPTINPNDTAAWARLRVIPFDEVIPLHEQDGSLPSKLRDAAPAVMAWVYEGWLEYQKQGLNAPDEVLVRTKKYHDENDSVGKFLAERTMVNVNAFVKASEFYDEYSRFAREEGLVVEPVAEFSKLLIKSGVKKDRKKSGVVYQGRLIMAVEDDDEPTGTEDRPF